MRHIYLYMCYGHSQKSSPRVDLSSYYHFVVLVSHLCLFTHVLLRRSHASLTVQDIRTYYIIHMHPQLVASVSPSRKDVEEGGEEVEVKEGSKFKQTPKMVLDDAVKNLCSDARRQSASTTPDEILKRQCRRVELLRWTPPPSTNHHEHTTTRHPRLCGHLNGCNTSRYRRLLRPLF
jgi:hypothetical protein